jgi:hypothetical protein
MRKNKKPSRSSKAARSSPSPNDKRAARPADRDGSGRFVPGNSARLVHGLRSQRALNGELGGPELKAEANARLRELTADQGDAGFLRRDLVKRTTQLTIIADTLADELVRNGIITPKGSQRAALTAYLSVIDRLTRLSATLGLERRTKQVPTVEDFLRQRQQQSHEQEPAS